MTKPKYTIEEINSVLQEISNTWNSDIDKKISEDTRRLNIRNTLTGRSRDTSHLHTEEIRKKAIEASKASKKPLPTRETVEKRAAALRGRKLSREHIEKVAAAQRGIPKPKSRGKRGPITEQHRENLRIAQRRRYENGAVGTMTGRKLTEEQIQKMVLAKKGKKRTTPVSQETRDNISKALKGRKGKPHSEEHKAKISSSLKARALEKKSTKDNKE